MGDRRFDCTVFGASGYTGRLAALQIARKAIFPPNRLCLAGRSKEKLLKVREEMQGINPVYKDTPYLVASVDVEEQVRAMAEASRVVINCVGPFTLYGEPVVRACAQLGTHYVDITGETSFIANMIDKYHDMARENGAIIIPACGFDSVPADCGAMYAYNSLGLKDKIKGVEGVVSNRKQSMSFGTFNTILTSIMATSGKEKKVSAEAQQKQADSRKEGKVLKDCTRFSKPANKWLMPMSLACDKFTVQRSFDLIGEPSVEYTHNVCFRKMWQLAIMLLVFLLFRVVTFFGFMRTLLKKLKSPGSGPSDESRGQASFEVQFYAFSADDRCLGHCTLKGALDAYDFTAVATTEAARVLVEKGDELKEHGVVTPATGLGDNFLAQLVSEDKRLKLEGHPAVE